MKNSSKKILITSALPYVNNVPHLGNIVGCVLSADVYARFNKLLNNEVLYICGADEYGTSTEIKARESNTTPREICDKYIKLHKEIYDWFQINFDYFGRTSTPIPRVDKWNHTEISQDIFTKLADQDHLIEKEIEQLYCEELNSFVSDRFIRGTCYLCNYENAKRCQYCGKISGTGQIMASEKKSVEHP